MSQRRSPPLETPTTPAVATVKKIQAGHFARRLEKACAVSLVLAMCSQLNAQVSLPTYNSVLASWGLFAAYSRRGAAVFGLLAFMGLSFLLDVVFLSLWTSGESAVLARDDESTAAKTTAFSVAMMSLNLAAKAAAMYFAAHLYAVLSYQRPDSASAVPGNASAVGRSAAGRPAAGSSSASAEPSVAHAAAATRAASPHQAESRIVPSPRSPSWGTSADFKDDDSFVPSPHSSQALVRPRGTAVPTSVPVLNLRRTPVATGRDSARDFTALSPLGSERKDSV